MVANDDDYHSVPRDVLTAIGKLSVAGGFLEGAAHVLLIALGGDPGRGGFLDTVRSIRRIAAAGTAEVNTGRLLDWCDGAERAMTERNRVLHSMFASVCVEDESTGTLRWVPIAMHLRSGARSRIDDPAPLVHEAKQISDLAHEAWRCAATVKAGDHMWRPPIVPAGTPLGAVPDMPGYAGLDNSTTSPSAAPSSAPIEP